MPEAVARRLPSPPQADQVVEAVPLRRPGGAVVGYRVRLRDGRRLFVKGGASEREARWLACLNLEGAPVPTLVGWDAAGQVLWTSWLSGQTIDDVLQAGDPPQDHLSAALLTSLLAVEAATGQQASRVGSWVPAEAQPKVVLAQWVALAEEAGRRLPAFVRLAGGEPEALGADFAQAWRRLVDDLRQAPLTLGPVDCNARNALWDAESGRVWLVDLSCPGWDWPERRLVQYATGLGGGRRRGRVASLLRSGDAQRWAACTGRPARWLDGHDLVAWALLAWRLQTLAAASPVASGQVGPAERSPGHLARVWPNWRERVQQVRWYLPRALGVPGEEPVARLRQALARAFRINYSE